MSGSASKRQLQILHEFTFRKMRARLRFNLPKIAYQDDIADFSAMHHS